EEALRPLVGDRNTNAARADEPHGLRGLPGLRNLHHDKRTGVVNQPTERSLTQNGNLVRGEQVNVAAVAVRQGGLVRNAVADLVGVPVGKLGEVTTDNPDAGLRSVVHLAGDDLVSSRVDTQDRAANAAVEVDLRTGARNTSRTPQRGAVLATRGHDVRGDLRRVSPVVDLVVLVLLGVDHAPRLNELVDGVALGREVTGGVEIHLNPVRGLRDVAVGVDTHQRGATQSVPA